MQDQYNIEGFASIIPEMLHRVRKVAVERIPQQGEFKKISIRFPCPDEHFLGLLFIEPHPDGVKRVAMASVYRAGTDRMVSNFIFFENTQKVLDWLGSEKTVAELTETYIALRAKAFRLD